MAEYKTSPQGNAKKPSFPASILSKIRGKSLPESKYERVVSAPLNKLFVSSNASIESFIHYKERYALAIAHNVAHTMLNAENFVPGDYKLLLEPTNGSKAAFLFESLKHNDIIGLKLIKGTRNGEEVRAVEIRYKKKTSIAQKGVELELGEPRMKAIMSKTKYSDVLEKLRNVMVDAAISPEKKIKLIPLLSAMEAEQHGQELMFNEACGNDPARIARAKGVIAGISKEVDSLEAAKALLVQTGRGRPGKISMEKYVGALDAWPFPTEPEEARQFYRALSVGSREFLGFTSKSYLTDALPHVYGVAVLEHTALDSISQMQNLLRLMHSRTPPSKEAPLLETIAKFDEMFSRLDKMVRDAAREHDEAVAPSEAYDSERWFLRLCSTMGRRRSILGLIREIEKISGELDSQMPSTNQVKKIIANMAFNLCRVGEEEARLADIFARHPQVQDELKNGAIFQNKPFKSIHNRLHAFVKKGKEEATNSEKYIAGSGSKAENCKSAAIETANRKKYKDMKAQIDANISRMIDELHDAAPALGDILLVAYRRSKAHVSYKQWETISPSPENHLTRLAIAQRLFELSQEPALREKYSTAVEQYLNEASRLFALFWSNHGSRSTTLDVLQPMRHIQEKGFDMVGDPDKHISQGNANSEIAVKYSIRHENDRSMLSFTLNGVQHNLDVGPARIYEASYLPFDFGEPEQNVRDDIYGRRITLSEMMPEATPKGPEAIFRQLYLVATRDPQAFDDIRNDMVKMNMGNARFPSTIAIARHRHSGCVAKYGDKVVKNLPLKYDENAPNTFADFFRRTYPDAGKGEAEARGFAYQQAARRAVAGLAVNKSHVAMEYINAVLSEKESG